MNDRCKHNNQTSRCCECLTEMVRAFEATARQQREQRLAAIYGIRTYRSGSLGLVTIPQD